ncbi:MAG: 1-acyl-sn-glycerol-3-phosphate acyltransferase, partial [Phycicoccus sp.]
VRLDDLHGRPVTPEVLAEATTRIVAAITAELEVLRGAGAPRVPFDPEAHGLTPTGRPRPLPEAS